MTGLTIFFPRHHCPTLRTHADICTKEFAKTPFKNTRRNFRLPHNCFSTSDKQSFGHQSFPALCHVLRSNYNYSKSYCFIHGRIEINFGQPIKCKRFYIPSKTCISSLNVCVRIHTLAFLYTNEHITAIVCFLTILLCPRVTEPEEITVNCMVDE